MERLLTNLMDEAAAIQTDRELDCALRSFSAEFNSDRYALVVWHGTILQCMSSYPSDWRSHYLSNGFDRIDPVYANARNTTRAFWWTADSLLTSAPEQRAMIWAAGDFGVRSGWCLPVQLPYGVLGMFSVISDRDNLRMGVDQHPVLAALAVTHCISALIRTQPAKHGIPPRLLTARQTQCLNWASLGKSSFDTSKILGISESAVCYHIKEARRRLDAQSVTHAVRKAIEYGLVG